MGKNGGTVRDATGGGPEEPERMYRKLLTYVWQMRLPWFGKLPGDIFIKKENFNFYFPLGSCILIPLVLSFVLWLFRR